jgi:hypothetical protein
MENTNNEPIAKCIGQRADNPLNNCVSMSKPSRHFIVIVLSTMAIAGLAVGGSAPTNHQGIQMAVDSKRR